MKIVPPFLMACLLVITLVACTSPEVATSTPIQSTSADIMPTESLSTSEPIADLTAPTLAPPTETPFPSSTPQPPTPTLTINPNLVATGEHLYVASLSPDGQWLPYWLEVNEAEDWYSPGGVLHVLNLASRESCALPQFTATRGGQLDAEWNEDNQLMVQDWVAQQQWRGQPCQPDSFVLLDEPPVQPMPDTAVALSPDGRYQVTLEIEATEEDDWHTMLTTLSEVDGAPITTISWRIQSNPPPQAPGGIWVSPTQFYLERFGGESLLLDATRPGQADNVQTTLFGLDEPTDRRTIVLPLAHYPTNLPCCL